MTITEILSKNFSLICSFLENSDILNFASTCKTLNLKKNENDIAAIFVQRINPKLLTRHDPQAAFGIVKMKKWTALIASHITCHEDNHPLQIAASWLKEWLEGSGSQGAEEHEVHHFLKVIMGINQIQGQLLPISLELQGLELKFSCGQHYKTMTFSPNELKYKEQFICQLRWNLFPSEIE